MTTAKTEPTQLTDRLVNGALVAAIVEALMRYVLHSEGFGTEVGGVQLEALISGLVAMLFGDKLPDLATWLKGLLASLFKSGGGATVAPDNPTDDEAHEPTSEEAKVAAIVFGKRLKKIKPARLESFRGIAAELGGEEYACVIPKSEAKPDEPQK